MTSCSFSQLIPSETLVIEDLIQNAHSLFDERPSPSSPISSVETTSHTYSSSPELRQPAEVMGSTTRHHLGLVGGISTSTQSSFFSLLLDAVVESHFTPSPALLLSPPLLELPTSSKFLMEEVKTTTQEQVTPRLRGSEAVETLANSTPRPVEVVSVAEWLLSQLQLPPQPEALMMPQTPPESMLLSTSDFPLSSAMSLQTGMG